jgi:hypothetical protein
MIVRSPVGSEEFIKFQVHRDTVLVLTLVIQEHHKECDDGRAGVDNQLPAI